MCLLLLQLCHNQRIRNIREFAADFQFGKSSCRRKKRSNYKWVFQKTKQKQKKEKLCPHHDGDARRRDALSCRMQTFFSFSFFPISFLLSSAVRGIWHDAWRMTCLTFAVFFIFVLFALVLSHTHTHSRVKYWILDTVYHRTCHEKLNCRKKIQLSADIVNL